RQKKLLGVWDERKEQLYADICAVYDAFPPSNAASSWYISGTALRTLSLLDHDALFLAKKYYQGDSSIAISTDKIDQAWRDVIAREYDNMKGIQKIGRNNGLCPYTPYEDLPETSKQLSEELKKLKPAKSLAGYSHPYHTMVYLYNDIVDDHNKFCDLSTGVFLLKTIKQPELFTIKYPEKKTTEEILKPADTQPVVSPTLRRDEVAVETSHEQTKIIRDTQVLHDTVYIEKRDTVYVAEADDNLRSMEGYATNNMVLLLDISGSMNSPEKLPLLKQSVLELLSMMRQEDEISIVIFSAKPKVLLNSTSFKEEEKISRAINDLKSSGKTDGNAALKMAYKVADENYIRGGNNRIILATDGEFPVSEETIRLIAKFSGDDIFLTIFDFGKGRGPAKNLEKLATLGKGHFELISKENIELKLIREAKAKKKK
ncbi:MAG: vWA domain-containing protein, partial [Bacteroidota bacterium]